MAYRAAGADTGDMSRDTIFANNKASAPKRKGICAPCQWFKESPLKRWQFALMLLFGLLTPVWAFLRVTGSITGDIAAGAAAFVLALYAANHFRILLSLKEQVDEYAKLNNVFKQENSGLKKEVSRLTKAREELSAVSIRLKQTTQSYEENILKFRALDEKLHNLSDDNIEGLERLKEMTGKVSKSIEEEMVNHGRAIVFRVQESMEWGDDKEGMNQEEWNHFIDALPPKVQTVFKQVDFIDKSGADNTMSMDEFRDLIDVTITEDAVRKFNK
eukprot:175457_1